MVKLSNNCHTDVIYSFGNEIALIAERHGLDPLEVIRRGQPRLPAPGPGQARLRRRRVPVEGPVHHDQLGRRPGAVPRRPRPRAQRVPARSTSPRPSWRRSARPAGTTQGARLAVLGWAYKGWPPTDDMRGTPIASMMPVFSEAGLTVVGHDPMVTDEVIRQYGGEPVSLDKAFSDCRRGARHQRPPRLPGHRGRVDARREPAGGHLRLVADPRRGGRHRGPASATRASATCAATAVAGVNVLLLGGAGFIGLHLSRRLLADGHAVTIVDDFSRGREDADLDARARAPGRDRAVGRPHRPGRLGRAAARLGPDLPAGRRRRRAQRRSRPGPDGTGQRVDRAARDRLDRAGRTDLLRLDQRGVRGRRRRRHRAGADRRGRAGDGRGRDRAPVRVRDQQAARRGRLPARRAGEGFRGGRRPLPQRVRPADGRRPRDPGDGLRAMARREPVPRLGRRPVPRVLLRRRRRRRDAAPDGHARGEPARSSTSETTRRRPTSPTWPSSCSG